MANEVYFSDLNYSLGNEDSNLERLIVKKNKPSKIISVCGSGSRAIPLITENTKELVIVDLSIMQLWLAQLRVEIIKKCSHEEFLLFWGYAPFKQNQNHIKRKEIFNTLGLEGEAKEYFNALFNSKKWDSILYIGKWEKTFKFFSNITQFVVGKKEVEKLFSFTNIEMQRDYIKKQFPKKKWAILLFALGNKAIFNALLYKGHFIKKNIKESYLEYYTKAFDHLFSHDLCKKSFFLQLSFFGEIIYPEGNLVEASSECFDEVKQSLLKCEIHYIQNDLISTIQSHKEVDFISLSDVPSYFTGDVEKNFFQIIRPSLSKDAIVINRNYLRIPNALRDGYKDITSEYETEIQDEKIQMYRIEILKNEI